MSIEALLQKAMVKGVKLSLVDGQIKYEGGREAVKEMLEPLRQHKAELTRWLRSANDSLSIEQNSEGSGTCFSLRNWNVHIPTGTSAATIAKFWAASQGLDASIDAAGGSLIRTVQCRATDGAAVPVLRCGGPIHFDQLQRSTPRTLNSDRHEHE